MTSKNLCFKLMREDLKRRAWAVALLFISFFFGFLLPVGFVGSQGMEYGDGQKRMEHITANVLEIIEVENYMIVMLVLAAAVVLGVSGFSYLHSPKKVDLYHSIPVSRGQLFWSHYLNGILMMAVIYLGAVVLSLLVGATCGTDLKVTFDAGMSAYGFHMSYFCLLYTTVVIAMMLTGNIIIALLGCTVFFAYGPLVSTLLYGYIHLCFQTYVADFKDRVINWLQSHSSPFTNYIYQISDDPAKILLLMGRVLLVTAVLALLARWLYQKRSSEAAGKAMAFKQTMMPIKILLVIPISLTFGIFFWVLHSSFMCAIFGLLCGAALTHCVMEIIYHFDFWKLFSHKRHFIFSLAASVVIFCGFYYDWFGYDSYLPKAENVQYASLSTYDIDDWVTYGSVGEYGDNRFRWIYDNQGNYIREHMKLNQISDVLSIASAGIELNKQKKTDADTWVSDGPAQYYTIQYTLKNGKKTARQYLIYSDTISEEMQRIIDSEEFKLGVYPVLLQTPEDAKVINLQQFKQITELENLNEEQRGQLLLAYQEDFKELTCETRKKEIPIATIQFVDIQMWNAVYRDREKMNQNEYNERSGNLGNRCYYPIYPSFFRTLKLLEQFGNQIPMGLTAEMIEEVSIIDYSGSTKVGREGTYTEPEDLKALAPSLLYVDYLGMNNLHELQLEGGLEAEVTIGTGSNKKSIRCYLNKDTMPDFFK